MFSTPLKLALAAAGYGALYELFPIKWTVLNANFVYSITVETGKFDFIRHSVVNIAAAAGDGALYGLFRIKWIVLNAKFVYSITVETGKFDFIRHSVVNIAADCGRLSRRNNRGKKARFCGTCSLTAWR